MKFEFIKKNYHIIAFILLYLSLLLGFFLDENTTFGPKKDFASKSQIFILPSDDCCALFGYLQCIMCMSLILSAKESLALSYMIYLLTVRYIL